jgi:hypothetical protein
MYVQSIIYTYHPRWKFTVVGINWIWQLLYVCVCTLQFKIQWSKITLMWGKKYFNIPEMIIQYEIIVIQQRLFKLKLFISIFMNLPTTINHSMLHTPPHFLLWLFVVQTIKNYPNRWLIILILLIYFLVHCKLNDTDLFFKNLLFFLNLFIYFCPSAKHFQVWV